MREIASLFLQMMSKKSETFVLSVGGSVFAPNGEKNSIDIDYLDKFETFIRKQVALDRRFFIVTGGGYTARQYRDAAKVAAGQDLTDEDLDWIGVHATRLNAHMFRTIFRDLAYPWILKHYDVVDKKANKYPVVVCGGWKPGWSTDYCTTIVASDYRINKVVNLSNIDGVYDSDPKVNKKAKMLKNIDWKEMTGIVGTEWKPGMNAPFDPIASKLAQKRKMKVVVCNGHDLDNLENILDGKEYIGTTIG